MKRSAGVLTGASFFLGLILHAQLVERIEVRVANIDVVVTDRSGAPVHGLTKEDFELFESGKPQTITNFSEVRADAAESTDVAPLAAPSNEAARLPAAGRHIV